MWGEWGRVSVTRGVDLDTAVCRARGVPRPRLDARYVYYQRDHRELHPVYMPFIDYKSEIRFLATRPDKAQ